MKQWYYVRNPEGYIVLELADSASSAKSRAAARPGFSDGCVAWPKACVPPGAEEAGMNKVTKETRYV